MKHSVAIIDSNSTHRNDVVKLLSLYYDVQDYDNEGAAFGGMRARRPDVILVGPQVGAGSGTNLIRDLRKDPGLAWIPTIYIADNEDFRTVDQLRDAGIREKLVQPYAPQTLLSLLSRQINGRVEQGWQALPGSQRKALESSLQAFNRIVEDLTRGKPLPFADVSKSCQAVVEAVQNHELGGLLDQIRRHDNVTYVHSLRFASMMSLFGSAIGLPEDQQLVLAIGGMLANVGMMTVPRPVLHKAGALSPQEWEAVRNHVQVAERILSTCDDIPKGVGLIVSHHHERLDGSGYPRGLTGKDLNQLSRMAGIIDVFCALTDHRPHKPSLSPAAALALMTEEMSAQLDVGLLAKFQAIMLEVGGFEAM